MQRTKKRLTYLIVGLMLAGAGGCGLSATQMDSSSVPSPLSLSAGEATVPQATAKAVDPAPSEQSKAIAQNTTSVTLFYPDSRCETLVPETAAVAEEQSLDAAIARVIAKAESGDFDLAGYRASVENGVATVDLRLSPDSPRHFVSMTMCEQFALFGSLRKTLTENPQWNVRDVRFTEEGQEILF
ncbi:MAG: GerMN domain-containing protein [Cyanobacteriota bacterium]|nr:GerMN domain-containing protein [Cyanobacteriota bacterium]